MDERKICNLISELSKSIGIENSRNILLKIKDNNIIYENDFRDMLIVTITEIFKKNQIDANEYENTLHLICNNLISKSNSVEALKKRYKWLSEMGLKNNFGLEKNHIQVYKIFDAFNKLLNDNNIEHYYTSGILAFTLINRSLERFHHDLDIFVSESNLETLERVANNYDFTFVRKLGDRPDGTKRRVLKMDYQGYDIPITVFMYKRKKDGSIIQKDYFYNDSNNLLVEEIYNSPSCATLSFSDKINYHNDIPYKAISLEALYLCKNGGRPKDIYDCSMISSYIDINKLNKLQKALKTNIANKTHVVTDYNVINFINGNIPSVKKLV